MMFLRTTMLCLLGALLVAQGKGTSGTALGNWTDIRGTNYVTATATARDNVRMWLSPRPGPGHFDPALVEAELKFLAAQGLNSLRIFGSFYAYVANPQDYVRNLATFLALCRKYRLWVTVVVWDCFGADGLEVALLGQTERPGWMVQSLVGSAHGTMRRNQPTLPAGWGGTWFASPGNRLLLTYGGPAAFPPAVKGWVDGYLDALGQLLGGPYGDVFLAYDLANEPDQLVLLGATPSRALDIAENLAAYTAPRLLWRHPKARFTVGMVQAVNGVLLHRRLRRRLGAGLHYLSYHDYQRGEGFDVRALTAAALGKQEGLEVVCSEFYTAARQGHLRELLDALHAFGIGGQLWGALEDGIFVVRYDDAFRPLYPRNPAKWWVRDTGVFRAVPDLQAPGGWRYQEKNPAFAAALRRWAAKRDPRGYPWPTLAVTPLSGGRLRVTVAGPTAWPVRLLVASAGSRELPYPGFGIFRLGASTVLSLGSLAATSTPGKGRLVVTIPRPPVPDEQGLALQAIVGSDYTLPRWEQSHRTLATRVVRVP